MNPLTNESAVISKLDQLERLKYPDLRPDSTEAGVVVGWGKTANNQSISTLTGIYAEKQQKLEVNSTMLLKLETDNIHIYHESNLRVC